MNNKRGFLYYGLLIYTAIFYSQIAGRFPSLERFRVEFIIGLVLVALCLLKIINGKVDIRENRLNLAAFFFIASALLTVPFALVKRDALDGFFRLIKFFAIYLMIISAIDSKSKLRGFMFVYVAMISLLFVEPFILSLQGRGFIYNNHMYRLAGVTGYFFHPNQLGGITAANLPFFYFLMKSEKSILKKVILVCLMIAGLRVIMLTQSRTAFVGVVASAFFIWISSNKKALSLIILMVLAILVWHFSPEETKERFMTLSEVDRVMSTSESDIMGDAQNREALGSMANRWELFKRGLVAFVENPLLGVGVECFRSFNGRRWGYWFPPHNTYVQALAEMGLVGSIAFLLLLVYIFRNLREARRKIIASKEKDTYLYHEVCAVLVYFGAQLVVSLFGQDLYENYWWLAGGLSVVMLRILKMESSGEETKLEPNRR